MHLPNHNLNQKHRDVLRSVLERKSQQVFASADHATAGPSTGFFRNISKKRKWEFGVTGLALATGLAIVAFVVIREPLSTQQFIEAAQAAYKAQPVNENGVVHQKYIAHYDNGNGTTNNMTVETWTHKDGTANIVTDSGGQLVDKYVTVKDSEGAWHDYDSNPMPGEILTTPRDVSNADAGNTFCVVNPDDFPDASNTASESNMTRALKKGAATQSRADAIGKILQSKNVKDLGELDGSRCFQITTNDFVYVYSFDPQTYALKKYTEEVTQPDQYGQAQYKNAYEYLVDETIDAKPLDLPIFNDTTGLTEIALPSGISIPNFSQMATGCYNEQGDKISDITVTLNADGSVAMVPTGDVSASTAQ